MTKENKSLMFSPATVVAMLMEAERNGFPIDGWETVNDEQRRLLELMPLYHEQITEGSIPEQIPSFIFPPQIGIAGFMEIKMEWLLTALTVTIRMGETEEAIESEAQIADGVRLEMGVTHFQVSEEQFVTSIETKTDDKIYVAATDKMPKDIFDLISMVDELFSLIKPGKRSRKYEDVVFPMVYAEEEMPLEWLKGLRLGKGSFIDFAIQKNELAVDEFGARVRSAAVGSMMLGIPSPPLIIRGPFLIWVERNGVVLFYGYIAEDSWKRPPKTIE